MEITDCFDQGLEFKPKERVYPKKNIMYLESGIVRMNRNDDLLKIYQGGDIINIHDMYNHPEGYEYVILQESVIRFVSKIKMELFLKTNPELFPQFTIMYAKELQETHERIGMLCRNNVKERMAKTFYDLSVKYGCQLDLNLKTSDWANYIGTSTETYIRMLSQFKAEGIVGREGRKCSYPLTINEKKIKEFLLH